MCIYNYIKEAHYLAKAIIIFPLPLITKHCPTKVYRDQMRMYLYVF